MCPNWVCVSWCVVFTGTRDITLLGKISYSYTPTPDQVMLLHCNDDIQPVIIIKFFTAAVQLRPTPAPIVNIPQLKFCQTFL